MHKSRTVNIDEVCEKTRSKRRSSLIRMKSDMSDVDQDKAEEVHKYFNDYIDEEDEFKENDWNQPDLQPEKSDMQNNLVELDFILNRLSKRGEDVQPSSRQSLKKSRSEHQPKKRLSKKKDMDLYSEVSNPNENDCTGSINQHSEQTFQTMRWEVESMQNASQKAVQESSPYQFAPPQDPHHAQQIQQQAMQRQLDNQQHQLQQQQEYYVGQVQSLNVYINQMFYANQNRSKVICLKQMNSQAINLLMIFNLFCNYGNISSIVFVHLKDIILIEYDNILSAVNARDFLNNRPFVDVVLKITISKQQSINHKPDEKVESLYPEQSQNRFYDNCNLQVNPPSEILHVSNIAKQSCH